MNFRKTGKFTVNCLIWLSFSCHPPAKSNTTASSTPRDPNSIPYHPLEIEKDLDVLIHKIGDAQVVLLGESTHGTHEYYTWREAITKRLVIEKGFDLMAIEGDWTDANRVNRFIKGSQKDSLAVLELLKQFDRWPSSMWGNYEMIPMVSWLNSYNQDRSPAEKFSFYGLDVYSFWEWGGAKDARALITLITLRTLIMLMALMIKFFNS